VSANFSVTNAQTDTQTTLCATSVAIGHIYGLLCMQWGLKAFIALLIELLDVIFYVSRCVGPD